VSGSVRARLGAALLGTMLWSACRREPARPPPGRHAPAARLDRRVELPDVADAAQRARLADTSAALVYAHRLRFERGRPVRGAPTLGQAKQLCPGERFADQPSWAFCSGTLVDRDLVLTAGHCLGPDPARAAERCRRTRLVFGYHLTEGGGLADPRAEEVYACRRVAILRQDPGGAGADYAILQLDRPVERRHPAHVARGPVEIGERLEAAGYGAGLPLKIEAATVLAAPASDLLTDSNAFAGASGGGLYDSAGELVAFHLRGAVDWRFDRRCTRAETTPGGDDRAQLAAPAVDALCEAGWPSPALCGTAERHGCAGDCRSPRCGDGLCEAAEWATCQADCVPYPDVPAAWPDDPETYRRANAQR